MAVKIRDEVELLAFLEGLIDSEENENERYVHGLTNVKYIDAGEDTHTFINEFYNNDKGDKALVLFLETGEGSPDIKSSATGYLMTATLACLAIAEDGKTKTLLTKRKLTRECLLNVFGNFEVSEAEAKATADSNANGFWEFRQEDGRFMPTGEMGNSKAYGYITNFEIWIESGKVIYKNL